MKKVLFILTFSFFCLTVIFSSASAFKRTDIKIDDSYYVDAEALTYKVDKMSLSSAKSSKGNYLISFNVTVDSDEAFEMTAPPQIALDKNFKTLASVDKIINENASSLQIEAYCDSIPDTIYVKMPSISKVTEKKVVEKAVHFSKATEYTANVDGEEIEMFALSFSANDFSVVPRMITLKSDVTVNSMLTDLSFDDNGNVLGGRFLFVKPDNYKISDTYDVLIRGTFEKADPAIVAIKID